MGLNSVSFVFHRRAGGGGVIVVCCVNVGVSHLARSPSPSSWHSGLRVAAPGLSLVWSVLVGTAAAGSSAGFAFVCPSTCGQAGQVLLRPRPRSRATKQSWRSRLHRGKCRPERSWRACLAFQVLVANRSTAGLLWGWYAVGLRFRLRWISRASGRAAQFSLQFDS